MQKSHRVRKILNAKMSPTSDSDSDTDSICERREEVNKLMIKMRNISVKRTKCKTKFVVMASVASVFVVLIGFFTLFTEFSEEEGNVYGVYDDFLIDGPNCKIPNMNPFAKEAMKVFKREKFKPCSSRHPLTSVEQNLANNTAALVIHQERIKDFLSMWQNKLKCCYKRVIRSGFNKSADNEVKYSSCKPFETKHLLEPEDEFIIVECNGSRNFYFYEYEKILYKNAHAIIRSKESVDRKLANSSKDKISVFLMGIDSISRLNLIRAMPETYEHLESNGWFELRGYNKMGDNTFPNLMAILTGQNETLNTELCNWKNVGELEKCDFIWKDYDAANYVTGYGEDETEINTFNYYETGFVIPPTDYYLRPFALAAEKNLEIKKVHSRMMCLGYQHYADYVYRYGLDFAVKYVNESSFGLFWTNSFSHEDLSMTSAMDSRVKSYLEELKTLKILDSSIVLFFSDHGMRFGPIRNHFIGWLEERLPFFYIWLPQKFQNEHPEIVQNLKINRDRLSSPYDVHITLKQILQMSGGYDINYEPSAPSCPTCQSLFTELPIDRSCADAGVDKNWCTCADFAETDKASQTVKAATNKIIEIVNKELSPHSNCAKLKLNEINSARKSSRDFLVSFNVSPSEAELEATIRCDDDNCKNFELIGSISRLNRYGNQSRCISDAMLRKYCYCI